MIKKIGIIGFGSFTREIICNLKKPFDIFINENIYDKLGYEIENTKKYYKCDILKLNKFDYKKYYALVTLSNISLRKEIISELPKNTEYYRYIDKKAIIMDKNIIIGKGSIICAGTILTTNIKLGDFNQLNLNTTIGHDTITGNYFTTAPGANISGNCNFGNNVYLGTNSSIKEKIKICNDVVIGLNTGVIKNIELPGIYVGLPAKKIDN